MFRRTKVCTGLMLAFGGSLAIMALPALAQQQLDRVEVTGSAIKRIDAETAVPVTVVKMEDLKKQGVVSVEQIMSQLSSAQMQQSTSQVVGAGTGAATFADLRGIGANKTLVLLNGRRIANNALDSSAPDLNMIPFAALERVEVLRDGASALYGTDAIGGVINFITRREYTGGTITLGADKPQHSGGDASNANIGFGFGSLDQQGFNIFGFVDLQKQDRITGTERPFNTREPGGISPTPFPANYFQGGDSYNPDFANGCSAPNLITDGKTACNIATAAFVNYIPKSERNSAMLKGTLKLGDDHRLGVEYFASRSKVSSYIAPVPYGGLFMNSSSPFYPGGTGGTPAAPAGALDPAYTEANTPAGVLPGFIHVKFRDLVHGQREDISTNKQQRFVASLEGALAGWDYQGALTHNVNKYTQDLAGYSNGDIVTAGVLNGIINPFGAQTAAGTALLATAGLAGTLQTAKGTVDGVDAHASREVGDWFGAGRPAALAIGAEFRHEKFENKANTEFATKVIASTGIDPNTLSEGSRNVSAAYFELNVPVNTALELTAALRHDRYSDFGSTTNPKVGFRFQPMNEILLRGSYSTGFRAPSLYELNAAQTYTNTSQFDDPVNCPGGVPIPGKSASANCQQQFQALFGGNTNLKPEKSKNATLGLVFEPTKEMSVGFDLWWVRVKQTIGQLADTTIFGDPAQFASVYHRNPNGDLSTDGSQCPTPATCGYVDQRQLNLGGTNTNGVDISASYRLRAGAVGSFLFGLQSTYVTKFEYQDVEGGEWHQNVGVYSGLNPVFRWQHNANVTWTLGQVAAGFAAHYKSGYLDQDGENRVSPYTTYDLYGNWSPFKALTLTLGVRNLTDKDPVFSNQTQVFQAGYDPRYTDPTGRTYYLRGTYSF